MPTISQLPAATSTGAQDELPLSQQGIARSVSVSELLGGVQPAIELPSGALLGRVSLGPGGPEPVAVGTGLVVAQATVAANGTDHGGFNQASSFDTSTEVIINAQGVPQRLPIPLLRGLFSAGSNVEIDPNGAIAASTDPVVSTDINNLTSGLASTNSAVAALAAKIPTGGYVSLNAQGQITAPMAGPVTLGTVTVGSGTPARTLGAKALDVVNVVDFGAAGGGVDCTAAFNAAFNALPATGGSIYIPAGDYKLLSSLIWTGKAVSLFGAGKGQTRIHIAHTDVGFNFTQTNPLNRVIMRDFSAYAESSAGQTAAVAVLNYPTEASFGYVSAYISDIECFGYPNSANGIPPFPQTFLRGFVLNNCWSVQINNVSWFGPPANAGTTSSAAIELNGSIDTRISNLQAYFGNAAVLQTGICQGIYISSPVVVGTDYLIAQTDITTWPGYTPTKTVLLGLWVSNGEVNTNLGTAKLTNTGLGFFTGIDITRNGGPNISQTMFLLANVSGFCISECNFIGGPSGGSNQDVAISFSSTFNSSGNIIANCRFSNMATVVKIGNQNATVGSSVYGIQLSNIPLATAFIDNSASSVGNKITFQCPPTANLPAGTAATKDHVFSAADGTPLFQIKSISSSANYIFHQAATHGNPPTVAFDGTDGTVNGVIQTKGGNLYINAAGGTSGSGNLLSLLNISGASNWPVLQNATAGNLSLLTTNNGGLGLQPRGALWLSPSNGLFASGLPTSKPTAGSGQIWNNGGSLSIA